MRWLARVVRDWWRAWVAHLIAALCEPAPLRRLTDQSVPQRLLAAPAPVLSLTDQSAPSPRVLTAFARDNQAAAFFRHCQIRLASRYGLTLDHAVWLAWNEAIRTAAPAALYLAPEPDGVSAVWRVWFDTRVVFVVVRDAMVVTALPNNGQFARLVQQAIRRRAAAQRIVAPAPAGLPRWQPATRRSARPLPVVTLPKLPPRHLWPRRDEAALARLRERASAPADDGD